MGFLFYAEKSNVTPPVMNNETKTEPIIWVNTLATRGIALAMIVVLYILLSKPDEGKSLVLHTQTPVLRPVSWHKPL
jgi:hypothetical protein